MYISYHLIFFDMHSLSLSSSLCLCYVWCSLTDLPSSGLVRNKLAHIILRNSQFASIDWALLEQLEFSSLL